MGVYVCVWSVCLYEKTICIMGVYLLIKNYYLLLHDSILYHWNKVCITDLMKMSKSQLLSLISKNKHLQEQIISSTQIIKSATSMQNSDSRRLLRVILFSWSFYMQNTHFPWLPININLLTQKNVYWSLQFWSLEMWNWSYWTKM